MQTFLIVWIGQIVSVWGTYITDFALGVWVYQQTGSITQFAFTVVFMHLPNLIVSSFAGAVVDRFSRRWIMFASDLTKAIAAIVMILLVSSNQLEIWHIYIAVSISSLCSGFQLPAYIAAIGQLVPKQHLNRANGMVQVSRAVARILGPTIGGLLVGGIGIHGVLILDFCTYAFALITLLSVRFPAIELAETAKRTTIQVTQLWQEISSGWNYIAQRPGLQKLMAFSGVTYLTEGVVQILFWPLVLSFADSSDLGIVLSISGLGMLFGSLTISAWGGLPQRVYSIMLFVTLQGLCMFVGGIRPSLLMAGVAGFGYLFAQPIIISSNQTIWQCKVPTNLQGRVFALQSMIERSAMISTQVCIGPLAEQVFEPMMAPGGLLADSVGRIIGVGPGRGIALLFMVLGLVNIVASVIAYRTPRLRRVEKEIPDAIASNVVSG